jgi:hypothetical protein
MGDLGTRGADPRAAGLVGMDGGWVVGPMKYCPICHSPRRKELDRLIVDRKISFWDVAKIARVSRHTVTTHSKHLVETYHEPHPSVFVYAPTLTNLVVLSENGEDSEPAEGDELDSTATEGGGGS